MAMAMMAEATMPQKMSWSVLRSLSRMSVLTRRPDTRLSPHLKRTKSLSQRPYWVVRGLSRPNRWVSRWISVRSRLPDPLRRARGSVVSRTKKKTSTDAIRSTGIE